MENNQYLNAHFNTLVNDKTWQDGLDSKQVNEWLNFAYRLLCNAAHETRDEDMELRACALEQCAAAILNAARAYRETFMEE